MKDLDVAVVDAEGSFGELVVTLIQERGVGRVSLHDHVESIESTVDAVVHCTSQGAPEQTVERIVEHTPGAPVVLLVGPVGEDVVGAAIEAGATICLPRSPEVVREHLPQVLWTAVERNRERETATGGFELAELLHETTHELVGVKRADTLERILLDGLLERFPVAVITRSKPGSDGIEVSTRGGVDYAGVPTARETESTDPTAAAHRTRLPAIAHDLQGAIVAPSDIHATIGHDAATDRTGVPDDVAERVMAAAADAGVGSALAVPIGHGGEFHGVMTVYAPEAFAFTTRDVKLLLALGDAAARAYSTVEQAAALEETKAERDRYRAILDAVGDAVFVLDGEGQIRDVNASGATVANRSREDLIGANAATLLEEDPDFLQAQLDAVFDGNTVRFEARKRQRDTGGLVEVRGSMLTRETAVAVVHDLTDRRDTERTLRRLREGVRSLLRLGDADVAAETAVRTMADALDASAVVYLLDEDTGALVPAGWTEDVDDPTPVTDEQPIRWDAYTTDREREIGADISPIDEPSVAIPLSGYGLVVAAVGDQRDVEYVRIVADDLAGALAEIQARESLQRRSETLERHNRLLDEFAAVVSHDLRNPLGAAMGFLDLARETGDESHFERVEGAHDRMNDLITQLLELSRRDNRLDPERVVFADLREDAQSAWSHIATEEGTLVVEDSRLIEANHDLLQELFENLFRNAVEHAGASPTITVGVLDDGFFVEDDGPGIDEGIREELATINRVTTDRGIGFGLSIVARIARAHEWDLQIGESADGGARFEFSGGNLREPTNANDV